MKIRRKLLALARTVAEEAEQNPDFRLKLATVLGIEQPTWIEDERKVTRSRARRAPAAFDPIEVLRTESELVLRSRLSKLNLEQLKDIVAQYGMDPGKLVMKWKTDDRVVDRIVELAIRRAQRGDAFRVDPHTKLNIGEDQD